MSLLMRRKRNTGLAQSAQLGRQWKEEDIKAEMTNARNFNPFWERRKQRDKTHWLKWGHAKLDCKHTGSCFFFRQGKLTQRDWASHFARDPFPGVACPVRLREREKCRLDRSAKWTRLLEGLGRTATSAACCCCSASWRAGERTEPTRKPSSSSSSSVLFGCIHARGAFINVWFSAHLSHKRPSLVLPLIASRKKEGQCWKKKKVPLMRNGTAHRRRGPKTALARAVRSCHADSFWPRSLQGPFFFSLSLTVVSQLGPLPSWQIRHTQTKCNLFLATRQTDRTKTEVK